MSARDELSPRGVRTKLIANIIVFCFFTNTILDAPKGTLSYTTVYLKVALYTVTFS